MLYREAGQFKPSYAKDMAIFPIRQDKYSMAILLAIAFGVVPFVASEYLLTTILLPFLVYSVAALGLNILTGYAGQLSLGTGAFMATGAFAAYKITTAFPELNIAIVFLLAGFISAAVGTLFGLPSLRIKGFYLAVATLAAQFFLIWMFNKFPWFVNYNASGVIAAPPRDMLGIQVLGAEASPIAKYLFALSLTCIVALAVKNLVRASAGRSWMAIRDMDIAAEIIGIRPLVAKLTAFAVSSFVIGIAGAMYGLVFIGSVEPATFDINFSFLILFMIIIGGLGSIQGSFFGAGFIVLLPIFLTLAATFLNNSLGSMLGFTIDAGLLEHLRFVIFGALIIFFLIVEPHGLARLWQIGKEKLRLWPFPY